jgi:hypothetical protein
MKNKITRSIAVVVALLVGALFFTGVLPSFFRSGGIIGGGAPTPLVGDTSEMPVGAQRGNAPLPID